MNEIPSSRAIHLSGLCKRYRISARGGLDLAGGLAIMRRAFGGSAALSPDDPHSFTALHPLDISIYRGESVAIIGENGSGKSTLLQLIARTLEPTAGTIEIRGRLCALLELGSGFNPDFTGLENVYLNGAILGLDRKQIAAKLDDIIAFADIGPFLHQPVRTYSSGMRMRLAFAVITAVDPEILIVDEALSVGDAFFQARCVRWLENFLQRDRTFLCVSHDLFLIQRLCKRGIVLNDGSLVTDAPIAEAVNAYYRLNTSVGEIGGLPSESADALQTPTAAESTDATEGESTDWAPLNLNTKHRTGDQRILIERIEARPEFLTRQVVGDQIDFRLHLLARETVEDFHYGIGFRDRSGQLIGGYHSFYDEKGTTRSLQAGERLVLPVRFELNLRPQTYLLLFGVALNLSYDQWLDLDCIWDAALMNLVGPEPFWGLSPVNATALADTDARPSPTPSS